MSRVLENVPTAELMRLLRACADQCVRVVNMPHEQRHRTTEKSVSPEQAGTLSAVVVLQYARELELRGVTTGVGDLLT